MLSQGMYAYAIPFFDHHDEIGKDVHEKLRVLRIENDSARRHGGSLGQDGGLRTSILSPLGQPPYSVTRQDMGDRYPLAGRNTLRDAPWAMASNRPHSVGLLPAGCDAGLMPGPARVGSGFFFP